MRNILFLLNFIAATSFSQIITSGPAQPQAGPTNPPGAYNTLSFSYDSAGNETNRTFIYVSYAKNSSAYEEAVAGKNSTQTLQELPEYPELKYYPNPVLAQLYLEWNSNDKNRVSHFEIYTASGTLLRKIPHDPNVGNAVLDFASYPVGYYNLMLFYNDGNSKTLKIVKQ